MGGVPAGIEMTGGAGIDAEATCRYPYPAPVADSEEDPSGDMAPLSRSASNVSPKPRAGDTGAHVAGPPVHATTSIRTSPLRTMLIALTCTLPGGGVDAYVTTRASRASRAPK